MNWLAIFGIAVVVGLVVKFLLWLGGELERSRQREAKQNMDIIQAGNITAARRRGIEENMGPSAVVQLNGGYFDGSIVPMPPNNAPHDNVLRVTRQPTGMAICWIRLSQAVPLDSFKHCEAAADFYVDAGRGQLLMEVLK